MRLRLKIIAVSCLLLLMVVIAACGGPAATPSALPATEALPPLTATMEPHSETPTRLTSTPMVQPPTATPQPTATVPPTATAAATPTEPLPSQFSQLPTVEIPPDHPAELLAMLPAGTAEFMFANIETVIERPVFQEIFEYGLMDFVGDEKSPSEELLRSAGVNALVLGNNREYEWSCILRGDFTLMQEALELATAISGYNPSTKLVEEHRGIKIFGVFLERSYAQPDVLYLAMPDLDTLALTKDLDRMREMIERRLDGGSLPVPLAAMLEDWGLPDYYFALSVGGLGDDSQDNPMAASRFYAFHATLSSGSATILRALQQFDGEEQAAAASAWLQEQTEPRFRRIGWGDSVSIDEWRQKGATVYAEATVPDEDMPALVQGN